MLASNAHTHTAVVPGRGQIDQQSSLTIAGEFLERRPFEDEKVLDILEITFRVHLKRNRFIQDCTKFAALIGEGDVTLESVKVRDPPVEFRTSLRAEQRSRWRRQVHAKDLRHTRVIDSRLVREQGLSQRGLFLSGHQLSVSLLL